MTGLHVVHVDMDAFFAAVEQRDKPDLRGKPVVVGGSPQGRGVVATASYEARRFGIHSAMPAARAYRLCPQAIFLEPDFARYNRVSEQIRRIMGEFAQAIEPVSIDEAFLDVGEADGVEVGRALKAAIRERVGLAASVGVAYNKFLAKLASDLEKPDGFTVLDPARAAELLPGLPVRRIWGIGPRSEKRLMDFGIQTIGDLTAASPAMLRQLFGRRAGEVLRLAQGIDDTPVVTEWEARSIGEETTFPADVGEESRLANRLYLFAQTIARRLRRDRLLVRTVTVKLKFPDFQTITRSRTRATPTDDPEAIHRDACACLARTELHGRKVRLLGLQVSGIVHPGESLQLRFELE